MTRRRRASGRWDIELDGLGLMCDRPTNGRRVGAARTGISLNTTDVDATALTQDVPRDWLSFEAGACYTTDIGVNGYAYSDGATALWGAITPIGRVQTQVIPTDAGHVRVAFEWKGLLWVVGQRKIFTLPLGGGAQNTIVDAHTTVLPASAANEIQGATLYKDTLVVGIANGGAGAMIQYDGTTLIQSAGTPTVVRFFLADQYWRIDGLGAYRLIGTNGLSTFAHTNAAPATTPSDGIFNESLWSATIGATSTVMADGTNRVTGLVVGPSSILFLTEGGANEVDQTGHVTNRTSYWKSHKSTIGKLTDGLLMGDWALLPHSNGLDRYNVRNRMYNGPVGWCQPGVGLENATPVFGKPEALAYWQGGAFGAFYNGADSWLCYGRDRGEAGVQGVGPMVWHTFKKFASCRLGNLTPVTDPLTGRPYLHIFGKDEDAGEAKAWRMDLPDNGSAISDLLYGSGMEFETSGAFYLTRETWGKPTLYKALQRFEITGRRFGEPSAYAALAASIDEGDYVVQGRVRNTPGGSFLAQRTRVKQLDLRLDLIGGSPTDPPIIDAVRATARYSPRRSEVRTYTVRLGTTDRTGKPVRGRDALLMWRRLRSMVEAAPIDVFDELGEPMVADIVDVRSVGSEWTAADMWERLVEITMVVTRQRTYYDTGSNYDEGWVHG